MMLYSAFEKVFLREKKHRAITLRLQFLKQNRLCVIIWNHFASPDDFTLDSVTTSCRESETKAIEKLCECVTMIQHSCCCCCGPV
jgi:hypothetical protein